MNCLRLANGPLAVCLHPHLPVVLRYEIANRVITGDPAPAEPVCMVYAPDLGRNETAKAAGLAVASTAHTSGGEVAYSVTLERDRRPAIGFDIVFAPDDSGFRVSLRGVSEHDDWQLVHVDLGCLASATTADPGSRLLMPTNGGRRLDPSRCAPGERLHKYSWVRESFSQVGVTYTEGASVLVRLESLNDLLVSRVARTASGGSASVGARMVHRMEAGSADLQFVVHRPSSLRLVMLVTDSADPASGWVPAAQWLHAQERSMLPDRYIDRFVCKAFVGKPGSPAEIPFDAVMDGIRRRFHLFDGVGQVCYLVGFQHEGHDSNYPDVFTCNPAAGGLAKVKQIIAEARTCNATLSFHDNYDDAYRESPSWDPADIAIDSAGGLLKGGVWNGAQAYWISLPKYERTKADARLRRTLEMYPVHDTYHLDVLTASVFRPDFDPAASTDRNDDLAARRRLVGHFRRRGLDVTTEGCGLPFLQDFRYFWDLPRPGAPLYQGDEPVPFAPFVAHGITAYGGSEADRHGVVEGLYFGAFHSKDIKSHTTEAELLDAFYLLFVPLNLLRDRAMVDYRERGASRTITYDDGSTVEVDFARLAHRVTVGGRTIAEDFVSCAPGTKPGTWLLYISALQDMGTRMPVATWPCPPEWRDRGSLRAVALTPTGDGERLVLPVAADGTFALDVPFGVPFRLTPEDGA
jgi:hypothetical protein